MFGFIQKLFVSISVVVASVFGFGGGPIETPINTPTPTVVVLTEAISTPTPKPIINSPTPNVSEKITNKSTDSKEKIASYTPEPTPTPIPPEPDLCRNIPLNQSVLPLGMYRTIDGDCFDRSRETPKPTPSPTSKPTPTPKLAPIVNMVSVEIYGNKMIDGHGILVKTDKPGRVILSYVVDDGSLMDAYNNSDSDANSPNCRCTERLSRLVSEYASDSSKVKTVYIDTETYSHNRKYVLNERTIFGDNSLWPLRGTERLGNIYLVPFTSMENGRVFFAVEVENSDGTRTQWSNSMGEFSSFWYWGNQINL